MTTIRLPFRGHYEPPVDDPYGVALTACAHGLLAACYDAKCRPPTSGGTGGSLPTKTTGTAPGSDRQALAEDTERLELRMLEGLWQNLPASVRIEVMNRHGDEVDLSWTADFDLRTETKALVQREIASEMMKDAEYVKSVEAALAAPLAGQRPEFTLRAFSDSEESASGGTLGFLVERSKKEHLELLEAELKGSGTYNPREIVSDIFWKNHDVDVQDPNVLRRDIEAIKAMSPVEYYSYQMARAWIGEWAATSADHSPPAVAAQLAASRLHGASTKALKDHTDPRIFEAAEQILKRPTDGPFVAAFTRAEYAVTQRLFAEAGVEEVLLYRGMVVPKKKTQEILGADPVVGEEVQVNSNPISSWSRSRATSTDFANAVHPGTETGVVMAMRVPVTAIQSTAGTGRGCLEEHEMLVIAGDQVATVERFYE